METSVLIVGAGPCGVTIANLLGQYGVDAVIIDREADIVDYPRGVGVDDESLRAFQSAGLAETVHRDMIQDQQLRYFDSSKRPLVKVSPSGTPFGWPRRNSFLQPLLEEKLRAGLDRFDHVQLRVKHELLALHQDSDGVTANVRDGTGASIMIRAQYVIGADGGRSSVRTLVGATLEGSTLGSRWLVVDVQNSRFHAPYAGNVISSHRPYVSIDLPYGYRRFEFRLDAQETDEQMKQPANVEALIRAHYDWNGPLDGLERARIYQHHSRVADKFSVGRVFLAGDAAHLQPPWFGQGMNSGIRDAANISWKLASTLNYGVSPRILDTYETERRDHAKAMIELATTLGRVYAPKTRLGEAVRSYGLRASRRVPMVRDYILQMKFKPMPYYSDGVVVHNDDKTSAVGRMFIQPDVEMPDGNRVQLDRALGNWFGVVGVNIDPVDYMNEESLNYWRRLKSQVVRVNRSRAGQHLRHVSDETLLLDDVAGGFRNWCDGRPEREILILRPDGYLAASCRREELNDMTYSFSKLVPIDIMSDIIS